eukprot:TRINITY_DN63221_c0_g1_i1.p1 TRINITY_DN63221_c0_g1~~TRINITY_DN63221_c0_g1_i1.p1  ORF type:complete len:110 (-),score=19.86 TRINITY_DN63221_c0_g1_i1:264-593(-)
MLRSLVGSEMCIRDRVYGWGDNKFGQLGSTAAQVLRPQLIQAPPASNIFTGWHHSVILTECGELLVFGNQPPISNKHEVDHATALAELPGQDIMDIKLGWKHGLALLKP